MKKLIKQKVSISYNDTRKEVDGYKVGASGWGNVHLSANRPKYWSITHDGTGYMLVDGIRNRAAAIECAEALEKAVQRLRKKYTAMIK